jgi:hypothetical protein
MNDSGGVIVLIGSCCIGMVGISGLAYWMYRDDAFCEWFDIGCKKEKKKNKK